MKFEDEDRVAVYLPRGRFYGTVTLTPYMPYILVKLDKEEKEVRVHPKQCRKLKKKQPKQADFKIGSWVRISPEWSKWFCEHMDVYYWPSTPNTIDDDNKVEVAFHMLVAMQRLGLCGKVTGYGMDDSIRIEVEGENILPLYGIRSHLIGMEYLQREKL